MNKIEWNKVAAAVHSIPIIKKETIRRTRFEHYSYFNEWKGSVSETRELQVWRAVKWRNGKTSLWYINQNNINKSIDLEVNTTKWTLFGSFLAHLKSNFYQIDEKNNLIIRFGNIKNIVWNAESI